MCSRCYCIVEMINCYFVFQLEQRLALSVVAATALLE